MQEKFSNRDVPAAIQQTAASQIADMAQEVANLARDVNSIAGNKLAPLRHDGPEECEKTGTVRKSFPPYFEGLSLSLEQIRSSLYETRDLITRCEI